MKKILLQLDVDPQPCSFDAITAVDAGVDVILQHGSVSADNAVSLVHGAMFTRGANKLSSTGIFLGGKDITKVEGVASRISETFFDSIRVSVFLDPAGANTTAVAAVIAAKRHISFVTSAETKCCQAMILGGTGPVGQRISRLLAAQGAHVYLVSRDLERASTCCQFIQQKTPNTHLEPLSGKLVEEVIGSVDLIISAGKPGIEMLTATQLSQATSNTVCIDLNAVPPAGINGIQPADQARRDGTKHLYGALSVGEMKMKLHKAAIQQLFQTNDQWIDAEALLLLSERLSFPANKPINK